MKFIGITGGVGAGKSTVLSYLSRNYRARVVLADELAARLIEPEGACYEEIRDIFSGENLLTPEGRFDRAKIARIIFADEGKRAQVNAVIHPAVKKEILAQVDAERGKGELDYFFFEAALLVEDGYGSLCDELWYIHAAEETRRRRLKESRGYSDDRIDGIFAGQLTEDAFRRHCQLVVDNDGSTERTYAQIREYLTACRRG